MEGILEKPSRIPGKKTKVWSVLDDTTLSFFQENKRSSCIDSVELSDIQSVKKVAETQFEIVTDISSQVYTAVSEEERKQWVEKLSKFSTGADNCKQSTPKSTPVIDIANEEDEHTVEVKSARKIFESTSTERQNTSPKTSVSKTFTWNDGSERSVGVKTAKKIFEAKNNKTNTTERVLTPSLRVNKNSNVEQTFEQKSSKTNLSENNPTTSSVAKILPESTSHNKPVEQVDENSDNEVFDTSVTNTATGVKTRSEKSNANFESKVNRDDNVKPKRPLSNITQEHDKTRKSDHKKSHSWSTITDVKSHLNHVSISDETLKSGRRLSDSLHQNSKTSDSLNPELEQARNKLKHISNIIVKQDKIETMKDEDKTVQSSSEAGSIINIDMISNPVLKDCETVTKSDYAEARENDELDSSSPNCLETTTVVGKTIEENGISANRPDSGYSTTVCENGRNSQENKVDINTANKTEEEKNEIMNSTHLEPEKKEDSTGRFSEDEDEEKEDTIVLMRKSKRSVSVSKTGDVALVPDEKEMELFTANTAFAFPNVRRSKKSSSTIENEDKDKKTPLILSDNSNLPKDITQSISGSFDKTRGDENNLSFNTEDREFGEISPVSGQDKVDGEINSMHPEHELVENYLDIDSIINKVKFPNIPTLPNTTPNRADLLSFHELKESLSYFDSEDEHSDDEVIEREDPVHRLSRLVDI